MRRRVVPVVFPGFFPIGFGRWIEAVAAGGFVVAAAVFFRVGGSVFLIDIRGEAMLASAGWTGEPGSDAGIF